MLIKHFINYYRLSIINYRILVILLKLSKIFELEIGIGPRVMHPESRRQGIGGL